MHLCTEHEGPRDMGNVKPWDIVKSQLSSWWSLLRHPFLSENLRHMVLRWPLSGRQKQAPGTSALKCPSARFLHEPHLLPALDFTSSVPETRGVRIQSQAGSRVQAQWSPFQISSALEQPKLKLLDLERQWCITTNCRLCTGIQVAEETALLDDTVSRTVRPHLQHLLDVLLPLRFCYPVHIPLENFDEISKTQGGMRRR